MKSPRTLTYALYGIAVSVIVLAAAVVPHLCPERHPPDLIPPTPVVSVTPPAPLPPAPVPVAAPVIEQQRVQPEIEVVFALDTTSSMTGLIDGAKRKIWSLVDYMASGQPQPKVRVGIVAYRDLGDTYVTKFFDLSDDIDKVFAHLQALRAEGGGDTPEHVAKAMHEAVTKTHWSQGDKVVKMIYVVGDAPGHTDYEDGFNANAEARKAAEMGIHVNAIRCGTDPEAATYFRQLARLGHGQYSTVEESGGVADVKTPFDEKMALLNRRLVGTAIGYGRGAEGMALKVAAAVAAPVSVAADRASFAAKNNLAISGEDDLTQKKAAFVNGIADKDLPAPLAALPAPAREAYVAEKQAERKAIVEEINALSKSRGEFMAHASAASAKVGKRAAGFDDHMREMLKAETVGVLSY